MRGELFDKKFNENEFRKFVIELLPDFIEERRIITSKGALKKVKVIGVSERCRLTVIVAQINEKSSKKRIAITQEAFRILRQYRIRNALIAFYNSDEMWRISLLTSTLKIEGGKIISEVSNPKRYSYTLGPRAKTKTPKKFLVEQNQVTDLDDLKERFSVEVVNKQFYNAVMTQFVKLIGGERGEGRARKIYIPQLKMPEGEEAEKVDFAVRLIGRIIFCWFLKEKKSAAGLSLMPENLLSVVAARKHPEYYHNVLEPVFFGCLNTKIEQREEAFRRAPFEQVPYLNGGLFNPQVNDFFESHRKIKIEDEWFVELFEILSQYNFTVDENTNLDVDLSIDPEMLGRIFENLLAEINPQTGESARKATGSFYTPREIVEYMVDEALSRFLEGETKIDREKIRHIMSYHEAGNIKPEEDEREEIIEALGRLKILDLACGSGAFPVGILQKVFYILQKIDPDSENDYRRKLRIIRQSIFGVDIQPIATEITKLRCFLALIIDEKVDDEKPNRGIEPLPNLDFKFVAANSLKFLPENPNDPFNMFERGESVELVEKVRDNYFLADRTGRVFLRTEFSGAQNELSKTEQELAKERYRSLAKWRPFINKKTDWFDSEWMFGVRNFDIVIGNPPYGLELSRQEQKYYTKHYRSARSEGGLKGSLDTFGLFMERGLGLLRKGGNLVFIIPMTITSNDTMTALQNELEQKCETIRIASFANRPRQIFDNACIRTSIVFCEKTDTSMKNLYMTKLIRRRSDMSIQEVIDVLEFVEARKYRLHGRYPKIGNIHEANILEKIFQTEKRVGDYIDNRVDEKFYYRAAGGRYFNVVTMKSTGTSAERECRARYAKLIAASLSTSLFWFYQQVYTDGLNLKGYEVETFPVPDFGKVDAGRASEIERLYLVYLDEIEKYAGVKNVAEGSKYNIRQFKEYKIVKSKDLIDKMDDLIDILYGLNDEEIKYIKEYEKEVRMSGE